MKVLIIGLGSIAKKHISAMKEIEPGIEIHALRSSELSSKEKDVKNIYELPDHIDYNFIIISNPTSKHAETINKIIKYNIPLFIEKPLFESLKYNELISKINKKGITTYVACNLRFLGCLNFIHKYLNTHSRCIINEVNSYCGSYLPDWRKNVDFKKIYSAIPELGGGVHLDLIHELDYICWLFGFPLKYHGILRNVSSLAIKAFDYANYCLIYPQFSASIILNYYRRDYKRTLEIVFEDNTWTVDLKSNCIKDSKGNTIYENNGSISDTYKEQMKYFISLIRTKQKAENDINYAYQTLKLALDNERS